MSKYDCTKTLDYAHEIKRCCNTYKNCALQECPMFNFCKSLVGMETNELQESIDIVQKWSDEHPEKTRKEAFLELFPKASISSDGLPKSCFAVLIGQENTMCVGRGCSDCWLKPYAGEFEKAREEEE